MLDLTKNILFFFIYTLTRCVIILHTLTHYVITRFLRFSEFCFAICSSYFISGFGAANLKNHDNAV